MAGFFGWHELNMAFIDPAGPTLGLIEPKLIELGLGKNIQTEQGLLSKFRPI